MASQVFDDKWVIRRALNEGGQGQVFLVYEKENEFGGDFVLKRLKHADRIGRIRNEVTAGLLLQHPNIVRVVDSSLGSAKPYIVTQLYPRGELSAEFIQGKSLLERLRLFLSICEGVAYAHEKGVIHRDMKPSNIFVAADETPVVGDFGLCFIEESGDRLTLVDEAVGARWFMAPELASGRAQHIKPACDVYSLGKLLYWILAGRIFDRERHREPEWELNPGQSNPDLTIVYELLDQTICADPSQRLRRGESVVEMVKGVIDRIETGRRIHELAGRTYCSQDNQKLRLVTFRRGSIVVTQSSIHLDGLCWDSGDTSTHSRPGAGEDANVIDRETTSS